MKLWFVLGTDAARRFVEPILTELVASGHEVQVSIESGTTHPFESAPHVGVDRLAVEPAADKRGLRGARLLRTFASYVLLRERWPPLLRRRWIEYFPPLLARGVRSIDAARVSFILDNPLTRRSLMAAARAVPTPAALERQLEDHAPDVVVVTPMIYPGTRELDIVRAARRRGVPTVGLVLSWDNLTSKATFHDVPDRLVVWNESQRREAVELHGVPSERVEALGAPVFDHLFDRTRLARRADVLASLGLEPDARYVLYAVSSRLGLGPGGEVDVVRRLADALLEQLWDGPAPTLLVRPHPKNATALDRDFPPNVVVTAEPEFPDSDAGRRRLHGVVGHATAVIGLNTSMFIEAAISGRPVIAIALDDEVDSDRDPSSMVHFEHLLNGKFLDRVATPEHAAARLAELMSGKDPHHDARATFVEYFVRPLGVERPAAEVVAERLTSLG